MVKILGGMIPLNVARFFDLDANAFMEELLDAEESDIRPLKIGTELALALIFFIFMCNPKLVCTCPSTATWTGF